MTDYRISDGVLISFETNERVAVFPSGIRAVGTSVLLKSPYVRKVVIPEGVVEIQDHAFGYFRTFSKMEEIVLPGSLETIGDFAFCTCASLKYITLPPNLKHLGSKAFVESGLVRVEIPESVETIGHAVFCDCKDLLEVVLPGHLTTIPGGLFYGCRSLAEVRIPKGVTVIEGKAFEGCEHLERLTLPPKLEEIQPGAFQKCRRLKAIHFPATVKSFGIDILLECDSLASVTVEPGGSDLFRMGDVIASACYLRSDPNRTERIMAAFRTDYTASTCVIPEGVAVIPEALFRLSKTLRTLELPDSLFYLAGRCFQNCSRLRDVRLPDGIETLPEFVFENCAGLRSLRLPAHLKTIERKALQRISLEKLTIPAEVKEIGKDAFARSFIGLLEVEGDPDALPLKKAGLDVDHMRMRADRRPLERYPKNQQGWVLKDRTERLATLPEATRADLLDHVRRHRKALWSEGYRNLILSEGMLTAGDMNWALESAKGNPELTARLLVWQNELLSREQMEPAESNRASRPLRELTRPEFSPAQLRKLWPTTKFGDGSEVLLEYRGTDRELLIPGKLGRGRVEEIGKDALNPEAVPPEGKVKFRAGYGEITRIELEEGILRIGPRAFANLTRLEEVTLPDSLERVGDGAFRGCVFLREITIPPNVKRVCRLALDGCFDLQTITVQSGKTKLSRLWEEHAPGACVLRGPDSAALRKWAEENGVEFRSL